MTYAESVLNNTITEVSIYDDERLKLFTGKISNVQSIVENLNRHRRYIIMSESDINRVNDGLVFAIGDKLCIGSIIEADEYHRNVQRKTVLTYVGADNGFVILDKYKFG